MLTILLACGTAKTEFKRILEEIMNYNISNKQKIGWSSEIILEYYAGDELAEIRTVVVCDIFKELLERQIKCDNALQGKY